MSEILIVRAMEKRIKKEVEVSINFDQMINVKININQLPKDVLLIILNSFLQSEECVFVRLVCKFWSSLITPKSISTRKVVSHYIANFNALHLIRNILKYIPKQMISNNSDDTNFFVDVLFERGEPSILQWAYNEIQSIKYRPITRAAATGFAKGGHLDYLQSMYCYQPLSIYNIHQAAASTGQLHILNWQYSFKTDYWKIDSNWWEKILKSAAENGHLHILQWLKTIKIDVDDAYKYAAKYGHLHIIEWLLDHNSHVPWSIGIYAGKGGLLHILKYLESLFPWCSKEASLGAARGGHLNILEYLEQKGVPWEQSICDYAARGGHFELLKNLMQRGYKSDSNTGINAAKGGHVDILDWLYRKGCFYFRNIFTYPLEEIWNEALMRGHVNILEWVVKNGFECGCFMVEYAAKNGHLDVLKFLAKYVLIDYHIGCEAAIGGQLEILKWLKKNGIPFSTHNILPAAKNGDLEMVIWLYENGCRLGEAASCAGTKEVKQWIEEKIRSEKDRFKLD